MQEDEEEADGSRVSWEPQACIASKTLLKPCSLQP